MINKNKHKFQKALSEEKLKLKYIPKLKFYLDDTFDEADKIEKLLSNEKVLREKLFFAAKGKNIFFITSNSSIIIF